jgi:GT2 family glycosyltransferase
MQSWSKTQVDFIQRGISFAVSWGYQSSVFHCRNDLVSMNTNPELPETKLQPFEGQDHDFVMWIDSDTVWEPDDIHRLIAADKDIISGLVPVSPERLAIGLFNNFDPTLWFKPDAINGWPRNEEGLLEVDFAGFAFMLVRQGVFESMDYPWFVPRVRNLENGRILFPSEDFGWCLRASELGWKIYAHPDVKLSHQKEMTMGP